MRAAAAARPEHGTIDFDLHGLAGIRLLDPLPEDAAMVSRQLGPIQGPLRGEPDIVIRFVDALRVSGPLRYLGLDEAGFTDDAFLVLRSKHKARARVQMALDRIGEQVEIVCERGLPAVPLLVPILNLTLLAKGVLALHASAFVHEGTGVVATGWSKGGKTEALLAFMERGAEYVGDEWVYLTGDGQRVFGIPEPIRLWEWQLAQLPRVRSLVARRERARLHVLRAAQGIGEGIPRIASSRVARRVLPLLRRQLHVDVAPEVLFGSGSQRAVAPFDRLFFVASRAAPGVTVEPIDPLEVGRRMVFSLQHERQDFMAFYLMYRFAFPKAANPLVEQAEELQRKLLEQVLAGKVAYAVQHPYPFPIAQLFDAMSPHCS